MRKEVMQHGKRSTPSQIPIHQAPEHEGVIVELAPEYLKRLEAEGKNTDTVW